MNDYVMLALCAVVSFFLGSIPWGVLVSRIFFHKDVRDTGSGNIGFTNSMRSMGKVGGAAVFLLDFAKGFSSGILAQFVFAPAMKMDLLDFGIVGGPVEICTAIALFAATMGHIFCPWLGFKGGKGISCAWGASFCAITPLGGIIVFLPFLLIVVLTRYVSLGSIAAAITICFLAFVFRSNSIAAICLICITGLVVIWAHRGNISRLLSGQERKISGKREED